MLSAHEINFDGMVGPTHNYAGLSHGNLASTAHRGAVSHPRQAALEGLAKMKRLADLGVPQAVLPPHARPSIETLRRFGFVGSNQAVLRAAQEQAPALLVSCASASSMWVANAATVTPSSDAADGRVHFTPANLMAKLHRSIETHQTARTLRAIFRDPQRFVVHEPVPSGQGLGDEGAANHTRFVPKHQGQRGLHLFVYGHRAFGPAGQAGPKTYPSRQALESSEAIARRHGLSTTATVFAQQRPEAIDAGVFHNDVISVGHENVFLYHEHAFVETGRVISELERKFEHLQPGNQLCPIIVPSERVSLSDAVRSYLFNSQLVTLASGQLALIAPNQCQELRAVHEFIQQLISEGNTPIAEVYYLDLNQSMRNGGGPACLRLRVVLNEAERALLPPNVFIDDHSYLHLTAWVKKHYREQLLPSELADPALLEETHRALDELTHYLELGSIYEFQKRCERTNG